MLRDRVVSLGLELCAGKYEIYTGRFPGDSQKMITSVFEETL
jgi:hypothetical protein